MEIARRYYHCQDCGGVSPWDAWAGLDKRSLTREARRMATLAGMSWSFDKAQRHLWEFCHLRISDDTIERVCQEEGIKVNKWMAQSPQPVQRFTQASGQVEFSTDGLKINTVDGWREMRISVWAKREACRPCNPQQWDQRVLNEPGARLATCAIARSNVIGSQWQRFTRLLGLEQTAMSVLADGAKWIWKESAKRFSSQCQWCLDIFHNSEHLHGCGKALFGEGPQAAAWAEAKRMELLTHNGPAVIEGLKRERLTLAAEKQPALEGLLGYLEENRDSMWYRQRLEQGLPIGSGLIEGACKNTLGARLKANSARWRVRRVQRVGALRCLDYSDQWDAYWLATAA
jgi:hypothetical protein